MNTQEKYERLRQILREAGSAAVAFSSGVDSTFLLWTAHDVLGDRAIAVTAHSRSFPGREQREAEAFCRENGIRQVVCVTDELALEEFRKNPVNRCYICKRALFGRMMEAAKQQGFDVMMEGSNLDDEGDYRPGMAAIRELEVRSPLREAQLTKAEIRKLSRELGLSTWDKPSCACLSSRFAYGETIDEEKLEMVERAEELLLSLGFRQVRVRMHGRMARIEVLPEEIPRMAEPGMRRQISEACRALGFAYVTLDLEGFRSGSMNETLGKKD